MVSCSEGWFRAAAVLAGVGLAGCSGLAAGASGQSSQLLAWKACKGAPRVECATLRVPVDWAHPRGPRIGLALVRLPAQDRRRRVGSLLFNCGGPGCPSAQVVKGAPQVFTKRLRRRFDIVGFDPRGIGLSAPIACGMQMAAPRGLPVFPATAADYRRLLAYNRAFARDCRRRNGPLLSHVGADDVVRDIEAIRAALDDGKLNWLGLSYGSLLGVKYAARYPKRIRTLALDGAIVPTENEQEMLLTEARAAEDGFNRWAAWCQGHAACPLHGRDVAGVFDRLVAQANASPIPAPGVPGGVSGEDIQNAAGEYLIFKRPSLFGPKSWLTLGPAIVKALAGKGSGFSPSGPDPGAHAVECADFPSMTGSLADLSAKVARARIVSPHLGGATQTGRIISECLGWPRPRGKPRRRIHVRGAPPILIVNSTHDPSTSYAWAGKMRQQIDRSVLLTRAGDGHTSYLTSPCAQAAIDRYLITRALPKPASVCSE